MIQPNEVQNRSEENNRENNDFYKDLDKFDLSHRLINSMRIFCKKIEKSLDEFINILLKIHIKEIEYEIKSKNYDLILQYYNFSESLEFKEDIQKNATNGNAHQSIPIKIDKENIKAVVEVCKTVKNVSPKKLIAEGIAYQFNAIIENIDYGYYEFLEEICNFSELQGKFKNLKFK